MICNRGMCARADIALKAIKNVVLNVEKSRKMNTSIERETHKKKSQHHTLKHELEWTREQKSSISSNILSKCHIWLAVIRCVFFLLVHSFASKTAITFDALSYVLLPFFSMIASVFKNSHIFVITHKRNLADKRFRIWWWCIWAVCRRGRKSVCYLSVANNHWEFGPFKSMHTQRSPFKLCSLQSEWDFFFRSLFSKMSILI